MQHQKPHLFFIIWWVAKIIIVATIIRKITACSTSLVYYLLIHDTIGTKTAGLTSPKTIGKYTVLIQPISE